MFERFKQKLKPAEPEMHQQFAAAAKVLVRKKTPAELSQIINVKLDKQAAINPEAARAVVEAVAEHHVESARLALARTKAVGLSPATLVKLSKDKNGDIRLSLASNPALTNSDKAIQNLLKDQSPWTRVRLAHNPGVIKYEWAVEALRKDPDDRVREVLPESKSGNPAANAMKFLGLEDL